jgi:hypothetical protein
MLSHSRVNEETGIAELRDLLGQEFHSLCRVAENNGLVYLQFREKGVETMQFFFFLQVGIELGHSLEGQLLHQVDELRLGDKSLLEFLDLERVSGRE